MLGPNPLVDARDSPVDDAEDLLAAQVDVAEESLAAQADADDPPAAQPDPPSPPSKRRLLRKTSSDASVAFCYVCRCPDCLKPKVVPLPSQDSCPTSPTSDTARDNTEAVPCGNGAVVRSLKKRPAGVSRLQCKVRAIRRRRCTS